MQHLVIASKDAPAEDADKITVVTLMANLFRTVVTRLARPCVPGVGCLLCARPGLSNRNNSARTGGATIAPYRHPRGGVFVRVGAHLRRDGEPFCTSSEPHTKTRQ
jgi:hypothetical protein